MNRNVVSDAILSMLSAPRDLNESEGLLMPGRDEILQFGVVHVCPLRQAGYATEP